MKTKTLSKAPSRATRQCSAQCNALKSDFDEVDVAAAVAARFGPGPTALQVHPLCVMSWWNTRT
jgi:hypothetical protein